MDGQHLEQEGAGESSPPLLEARAVSKRFGGVQAVDTVSIVVQRGSVHGLVGENGAGKSTLAKIIGGVIGPDGGEILVDGQPVRFHSPRDALAAGIVTIAQEIALVPALSVAENVLLGIEPSTSGFVRRGDLRNRFEELNTHTGFRLRALDRVGDLRTAEQQKVEILRAIARDARLILMDEPSAALTRDETDRLLGIVRELAASGTSIVLVSHYLDQVLAVSDQVTVMRNGKLVRSGEAARETPETLVAAMIGREMSLTFPVKHPPPADARVVLEARGLTRKGALDDVSVTVRRGEIVGLAGLVGSGRTELARAIFGADGVDDGEVLVEGTPVRMQHPAKAVRTGIGLLPESRKDQGLLMGLSVRENTTIARLADFTVGGFVRRGAERQRTRELVRELDVRTPSTETEVVRLSGGNQQKVLFAKWLVRRPLVLLADEPTRGVDVGAKPQIHELLIRLAAEGTAVLLISSEIEEVLGLAHRVLVMRRGAVVSEFTGDEITEEAVMNAAFAAVIRAGEAA
jgi:rhamnose transport system ATP-binding protein